MVEERLRQLAVAAVDWEPRAAMPSTEAAAVAER